MPTLTDPVVMSGGPIEEPQEDVDWVEGTEKESILNGKIHTYRRLVADADLGLSDAQAVYCGSRKVT